MLNMLKACYDWRVISALAAIGVAVFVLAPNLILGALPLLLVAACPLSMILMMKTMGSHDASAQPRAAAAGHDRVAQLRAELAATQAEQQRLARELDDLERESLPARAATSSPPS